MKFWDLLYKRYSNPMTLLSQMLRTGQLSEFINSIVKISNDENLDKVKWEYWLHRIFDKGWDEYLAETEEQPEATVGNLEATVKTSYNMLANFKPE